MNVLRKVILPAIIGLTAYLVVISGKAPQLTGQLASAAPLSEPTLSLVAPADPQSPEGTIDVQVVITGTAGLAALEFDLVLDQTLVEVSGITIAPLLGGTNGCDPTLNRCAFSLGPLAGNDVISLGGYSYGDGAGTASEGTLATIHLATTGITGTTALSLVNARLADVDGNLIEPRVNNTSLVLAETKSVFLPMVINGSGNPDVPRTPNDEKSAPIEGAIDPNIFRPNLLNSANSLMSLADSYQVTGLVGINPDVNGDRVTDVVDIQSVASCWGMTPTDPGCGEYLDLNGDQLIDGIDVGLVVARWKVGMAGIKSTTPTAGESMVSISRETIIEFSRPIDASTVTSATFKAEFGGQEIASHLLHSSDGERVTLFYDQGLPASARVRVIVDGYQLKDVDGYAMDPNGDGLPGGLAFFDFDTLSLSPVPGTDVWGYVYDSYNTTTEDDDIPVVGATIRVDGLPGVNAVTDSAGYFLLEDVPAPEFFVHIDGGTASSAPPGTQYANVGKAFHSIPGRSTQLIMDGETFDIYLPPMDMGDLVSLSPTEETEVGFGPAGKSELAELFPTIPITVWNQTMVMFPPESAIDNQGNPATEAAIIPVDASRLPAPLPPGINHQLDIAVMTPGASNFDEPAPACFPNLSDVDTGEYPLPGEKASLMSFNHDTGKWELVGLMTVTEDGQMVCTDPDVGIRAPGWHGVAPEPAGPPPRPRKSPELRKNEQCKDERRECLLKCTAGGLVCSLFSAVVGGPACAVGVGVCAVYCVNEGFKCLNPTGPASGSFLETISLNLRGRDGLSPTLGDDPIEEQIGQLAQEAISLLYPFAVAGQEVPPAVQDQVDALLDEANTLSGGDALQYIRDLVLQLEEENAPLEAEFGESPGNAPPHPVLYLAEVHRPSGSLQLRGWTEPYGQYSLFLPRDGELQYVSFYDPQTQMYGQVSPHQRPDAPYRLPRFTLFAVDDSLRDSDEDRLADVVEFVYGTDATKPDTDGDGIPDGAEVEQGSNPLDGQPVATGIIASADTPGKAVDVCAVNDIAAVADSAAGVSLFSVIDGQSPVALAQVDTPGNAQRVACPTGTTTGAAQNIIAVADGPAGLALVDVTDPPSASIVEQIALDGDATAVVAAGGIAYVGTSNGIVIAVDMVSGSILKQVDVGPAVQDLAIEGDTLFVMAGYNAGDAVLQSRGLLGDDLVLRGSIAGFKARGDSLTGSRRLFVGGGFAFPTSLYGYDVIDVSNPSSLQRLVSAGNQGQSSYKQIVANGSGLGVATVGVQANNTDPSLHQVYLYDTSDPTNNSQFLSLFETPGVAYAASIYNGLAYVADGEAGLQVVNYLAYDSQGVPPTITLSTNATLPNLAEEGKVMRLTAAVEDDVQIRFTMFAVDGMPVADDGAFPFEHRFVTPLISQQPTMTLQARAVDTGGNIAWSTLLTFTLAQDATQPQLLSVTPVSGSKVLSGTLSALSATFSEPIDPLSLDNNSFTLTSAGPDGILDNGDDVPVSGGIVSFREENNIAFLTFSNGLASGLYRAGLTTDITDLAGNPLTAGHSWTFTSPAEVYWDGGGNGFSWDDPANWHKDELPQNGDDVFIDDPGEVTVIYSTGTTTVYRLQSEEAITLSGGTLSMDIASFINNSFTQSGGILGGAGTLTVGGMMTWTAGNQHGSGETVAAGGLLLEGGVKELQIRRLTLDGPSTWTAGEIRLRDAATLTNNSSFDIQTDENLRQYTGAVSTFINNGTVSKTAGTGTTAIQAHPNNNGTMEVLTGTLSVGISNATGNSEGTFTVSARAKLDLKGNQTMLATSVITGAGSLSYSAGGTTAIQGSYGVGGPLTVSAGTLRFETGSGVTR